MHAHGVGAAALYRRAGPRGRLLSRTRWASEMGRTPRDAVRAVVYSAYVSRVDDLKALSRLNRSQHVTHHRLHNGTILAARAAPARG